ncbi:MAG TPA: galactofuranose ABC transporter, permease protein YjfF [Sphingomicrobium sp.]|nr:galactofuranose ABC transporter, permease protein YjfF [Sphingomicrobium sp.]
MVGEKDRRRESRDGPLACSGVSTRSAAWKAKAMKLEHNRPLLITLVVFGLLVGVAAAQFPFILSGRVVGNLLTDSAFLGVLALGMTVVIISGGIDLSVGAVLAFVSVLLAVLIEQHQVNPFIAFACAIALSTGFGALLGSGIHFLKAPPFIVTLAGMFLARGGCFLLTNDSIPVNADVYQQLSSLALPLPAGGRITLSAGIMLLALAATVVMLRSTRFGANIYALGGDQKAARLMGVRTGRTTIAIYAFSGMMAGIAGILFSIYTQSGYPLAVVGIELDAIAAVVIGGTLLSGGYGGAVGTFFGVLILGLIQLYITLEGTLSSWWGKIATGTLLFLFIAIQQLMLMLSSRRRRAAGK